MGETDPFRESFLGTLRCVVVSELAVYQRIGCMTAGSGRTCTTQRQDVFVAGPLQRCLHPAILDEGQNLGPKHRHLEGSKLGRQAEAGEDMRDLDLHVCLDISFSVAAPKLHVSVEHPINQQFSMYG